MTGLHKMLGMVSVHTETFGHNTVCNGIVVVLFSVLFQFDSSARFVFKRLVPSSRSCRNKSSEIIFRNWDGRSFCKMQNILQFVIINLWLPASESLCRVRG